MIATVMAAALHWRGRSGPTTGRTPVEDYLIRAAWARSIARGVPVKPWAWADTWPVARLVVATLGVDLVVLAGDSLRSLALGPGHRFGTAAPGEHGRAVVTGDRERHFGFLAHLASGTPIDVQGARGGWQRYRVTARAVLEKSALRVLGEPRVPELTLVTSQVEAGRLRLAVHARCAG